MKTAYHKIVDLLQEGKNIQTGTLLQTKGSAPQVPGAMAIFDKEKVLYGTLGGGLLEAEAQKIAASVGKNPANTLQWMHFNAGMEDKTGAICGGSSLFFIDAKPGKHWNTFSLLVDSVNKRKSGVLVTTLAGEDHPEIERFWIEENKTGDEKIQQLFKQGNININRVLSSKKPEWIENIPTGAGTKVSVFAEPVYPVSQLVIVGAGHVGQALGKISSWVDFDVIVVDDRPEMANPERFPEAFQIICKPFTEAFGEISINRETYIVIATQGHRSDIEALKCCIDSCAAYIGVIGSKRKTALMGKEFVDKKWATQEEWNFIHAPIGIEIHSKSVNEIAVSILAELIKERFENNFLKAKKRVEAVVLAAGKSTRMGEQKLLMPFKKSNIIRTVVEEVTASAASRIIVVTGSHKIEVEEAVKDCNVVFAHNKIYGEGMLSSVQKGVETLDENTGGFLVLLGDQPMVSRKVINRLISVFQKTEKGLIAPVFKGKRGHPVLIAAKYGEQIKSIHPEIGLRELFIKNREDILEVEINSNDILKDIDTPEDYQKETGLLK